MVTVYTPAASVYSKASPGLSDVTIASGVYKFMGCSIVSVSSTVGFNGTASSLSITLVEDVERGDSFEEPDMPSVWAISLPKGGVGYPIIYQTPVDLNPDAFVPDNVKFYFCGICTSVQKSIRDSSGRMITVNLVDPRELMSGIQCLLNGFALSQNIGGGGSRYTDVNNVIDVFGYFDYGMESERNEYGMLWSKIKECIEDIRVTVKDINMEFLFTNDTFNDVPTFYRISDEVMDLIGLCQRVSSDGGSDFICVARKIGTNDCVIEIRGIRRENNDPITQTEIDDFISDRTDIVETVKRGSEARIEPTSHIIIGGMRNANYTALPTEYDESLHLTSGQEDYNNFEPDIKSRLFGGYVRTYTDDNSGGAVGVSSGYISRDVGAIFPFWGFSPDDHAYPIIEPFLSLSHLSIDRDSEMYADLSYRLPICKIEVDDFPVRTREHQDMFLDGDGDSDERPFAYISHVIPSGNSIPSGYVKGLPLNTDILRAAVSSRDQFYYMYQLYYPDIAMNLFPGPNFTDMLAQANAVGNPNFENRPEFFYNFHFKEIKNQIDGLPRNVDGEIDKTAINAQDEILLKENILWKFSAIIWSMVRQYALEHMGRLFLVALPRSEIMHRIWDGDIVPTNTNIPEIEYVVDQRGYWEYVPTELDGIVNGGGGGIFTSNEEDQIRRKFMAEDGRFYAMVGIDTYPSGNASFNSNGLNKAMFQDLPVSEFRPNKIESPNPSYVLTSCSVNQLAKRPDLALVELPGQLQFDPHDDLTQLHNYETDATINDKVFRVAGIARLLWYLLKKDDKFREAIAVAAPKVGKTFLQYASIVIQRWSYLISIQLSDPYKYSGSAEFVMDLKGVIIPLTSTWRSYGPWYATYTQAKGIVEPEVDQSLVPWNFDRPISPDPWYTNLDAAGFEKLTRTISDLDYVENAQITIAGFPEMGIHDALGYNSNITSIAVDFGIGGIKTTYNLSTYASRPGTYRKADYDNLSEARIETRETLPETTNINVAHNITFRGTNTFNPYR